ncbi:MAG: hypothetical protein K0S27_572 [Gammaproteobacteria bacterium]|jgi:hypothetical protein|nr:hypothetical protein [Gammaproteobacteria bacterium]
MKQETSTFYIFTALLILLAYFIQTQTFFSPDVGYLLHAANQLLAGGKYGPDIFETNPPMILYLYFPACLLAKCVALSVMTAVRIYIIGLVIVSLSVCFFLLKRLIKSEDNMLRYALFYTLIFCLLFLPSFIFAQREHILIIFMLPYLLSAALALENKSVPSILAALIGVMAGLGFSLKPFFLVTPCLIELYFIVKRRRLFAWVRIESGIMISVLVIYFISIFWTQPGYIKIILPFVFRYYFIGTALPWHQIILFPNVLFCIAVALGYWVYKEKDCYSTLGWIMELALLGMIIAFLIPQTPWYYHVMPALVLALLLVASLFFQAISGVAYTSSRQRFLGGHSIILIFALVVILTLPASYCYKTVRYIYRFQDHQPARYIADYINHYPGQHSIACFGLGTPDCFPLVYYTQSEYSERFPFFWWYSGLRKLETSRQPSSTQEQLKKDKYFLINSFAEDLNKHQPRWVIIDTQHFQQMEARPFDVIRYFSENKKFDVAWRHYRYLTTIKSIKLYERAI